MSEENLRDMIRTRPIPQREQLDDGSSLMKWRLEMSLPVVVADLTPVLERLSTEDFSVRADEIDPKTLLVSIRSQPRVSYTDLWDFSIRLLLIVEKYSVEIAFIEGTSRDEWRHQFVVAENCGVFDADKTPTMIAAASGDIERVKTLLSAGDVDINESTPFGFSALGYAAEKGHIQIVELLINDGATPTAGAEITTLQAAVYGGLEVTKLLLAVGADVNAGNRYGETPLMLAAALGKLDVVNQLLSGGADPNVRDKNDRTALDRARQYQRAEVEDALRSSSA